MAERLDEEEFHPVDQERAVGGTGDVAVTTGNAGRRVQPAEPGEPLLCRHRAGSPGERPPYVGERHCRFALAAHTAQRRVAACELLCHQSVCFGRYSVACQRVWRSLQRRADRRVAVPDTEQQCVVRESTATQQGQFDGVRDGVAAVQWLRDSAELVERVV